MTTAKAKTVRHRVVDLRPGELEVRHARVRRLQKACSESAVVEG
jgi:hypothetical protein